MITVKLELLSLKDQAAMILEYFNGSWLYNAIHKELESEEFCKRIVTEFNKDYAGHTGFQDYLNEVWPIVQKHRA